MEEQEQINLTERLLALNNNIFALNKSIAELKEQSINTIRVNDIMVSSKLPIKKLEESIDRIILKHKDFLLMKKESDIKTHAPTYLE
jgi:hypothetical protein